MVLCTVNDSQTGRFLRCATVDDIIALARKLGVVLSDSEVVELALMVAARSCAFGRRADFCLSNNGDV